MALKLRTKINFPATVTATGGLTVVKTNGIWTVSPDFSQLAVLTGSAVTDPSLKQVWLYDPTLLQYNVLTLSGLGDALYATTSTTSLAIATGAKTFTVGLGRNFAVGSFVQATSAASSANYMVGQVTSYSSWSLVINVTSIGGSGTHADWNITLSGAPGPGVGNQSANAVYAGPTSGGASAPAFRALVTGDLPAGTGSGSVVYATSPTLITPTIGVATATSVNKVALTAPAIAATITVANNQTLTVASSLSIGLGQVQGTATNDSAAAGFVGEYISSTVASGSAISLTSATAVNITSISLTAGDWDVSGNVLFTGGTTTTVSNLQGAVTTTSATMPIGTQLDGVFAWSGNSATTFNFVTNAAFSTGKRRLSLNATTTVYLVAVATFGTSTASAFGSISARRMR